jgi:hypothetical protein
VDFLRLWLYGYTRPSAFVDGVIEKPGWVYGFAGQGVRVVLDSMLLYLPAALLGRMPQQPPVLPIPADRYFWFLVFAAPTIIFVEMLLSALSSHVILRVMRRESDLGFLGNIGGMCALVVGAVLVLWDWSWFAIGFYNQYFLGITHLILDVWAIYLTVLALKRRLGVPIPLGIALNIIGLIVALSLAVPFMRASF